jgi:hypothetical protein
LEDIETLNQLAPVTVLGVAGSPVGGRSINRFFAPRNQGFA